VTEGLAPEPELELELDPEPVVCQVENSKEGKGASDIGVEK